MRPTSRQLIYTLILVLTATCCSADSFTVGFFEGGPSPSHAEFRDRFRDQLARMTPPNIDLVYSPDGFKTADWERDKSRTMAQDLAQLEDLDLVVALGPWTVEDLLAAGFDRPIVAALRYDPGLEGLTLATGQPVADNLTVRLRPDKLNTDIAYLTSLAPVGKLGVLSFPHDTDNAHLIAALASIGGRAGFEVVTAEGYDRNGTYAFFKAYNELAGKVDALYLPPLWGFDSDKTRQFFAMLARDRVLSFSSEGQFYASRGALAAGSQESSLVKAHYHAWKVVQIMNGAGPADLPTSFADSHGLFINEVTARQLGLDIRAARRYDISVIDAPPTDDMERLTVVDAVNIALAQNPDYQSRYAALEAAEQAVGEARSGYFPQLGLQARADHFDRNAVNNDDRYRADRLQAGIYLDQELFAPGISSQIDQASIRRDVAGNQLRQAGLDLERAVTLAFLRTVQAEQSLAMLRAHETQVADCLQLARLHLALGEAGPEHVWRWESERLDALQLYRAARADLSIARVRLNTLMGRPGDYPFVSDWQHFTDARFFREESLLDRLGRLPEGPGLMAATFVDLALASNPELTRSELMVDLQNSKLHQNRSGFYPKLGFSAQLGMTRERANLADFEEKNPNWSAGISLTWPLFEGGRRAKAGHRLGVELDRHYFLRDQASLQVAEQVRAAVTLMLSRAEEFVLLARAAELANRYYPELQAQFAGGLAGTADLLEAVHHDRDAGLKAIEAQIAYFYQVAELGHAAGLSAHESGRSINEEIISHISAIRP